MEPGDDPERRRRLVVLAREAERGMAALDLMEGNLGLLEELFLASQRLLILANQITGGEASERFRKQVLAEMANVADLLQGLRDSSMGALYPMDSNHGELDRVTPAGRISSVIDVSASQGHVVPTALVHHGATYIANLGVFDPTDAAGDEHVWRLTAQHALKIRATGVEKVLGLAFRDGKLYALEMSTTAAGPTPGTGAIVQLGPNGPIKTIVSDLTFPTGMTVGPDGAFYVSNQGFGFGPGQGQVLRIKD